MTDFIEFSSRSHATLHSFDTFSDCARMTLPYLTRRNVALSGGATYASLYALWTALSPDCRNTSFFPVDERMVPFNDPHSNWGHAYTDFLDPIGNTRDKKHFASSLQAYSEILFHHFKTDCPVFDTIFLGVGDDGHTASLFPDSADFKDRSSVVLQTKSPKPPVDRITLAPKVLVAAKECIVIIAGENKKGVVASIIDNTLLLPVIGILSRRRHSDIFVQQNLLPL